MAGGGDNGKESAGARRGWTVTGARGPAMTPTLVAAEVPVEKSTGSVCSMAVPKIGLGVTSTVGLWGVGWRIVAFPDNVLHKEICKFLLLPSYPCFHAHMPISLRNHYYTYIMVHTLKQREKCSCT